MIDAALRSRIDKIWDLFWSGGIANPLTAIEQISYLIFMKRLDETDERRRRDAEWSQGRTAKHVSIFKGKEDLRWSKFRHMEPAAMLEHVRDKVFPFVKGLGKASPFAEMMKDAVFIIPKASLLAEAVEVLDQVKITEQDQDTQGDIYEYLLSELKESGKNGQFRTPRHVIRAMTSLVNPKLGERICDPACGTGGFLIGAYRHILRENTTPDLIREGEDGVETNLIGDRIADRRLWKVLRDETFFGSDFDTTMLRIAVMNLALHGIERPNVRYFDSLSKAYTEADRYQVVLANPPFTGSIDKGDIHETLKRRAPTAKTELLFVALIERILETGGRAAVIVPDGVLFGSSKAHVAVRKFLVEENQLDGVVSLPGGVFKPYSGVSTAILLFTKGGETDRVFYYQVGADGFSLDDKRDPTPGANDLPDLVSTWRRRASLKEPAKGDRWFWVEKKQIKDDKEKRYDLSPSKYRPIEYDEVEHEDPKAILDRILKAEEEIRRDLEEIRGMIG